MNKAVSGRWYRYFKFVLHEAVSRLHIRKEEKLDELEHAYISYGRVRNLRSIDLKKKIELLMAIVILLSAALLTLQKKVVFTGGSNTKTINEKCIVIDAGHGGK